MEEPEATKWAAKVRSLARQEETAGWTNTMDEKSTLCLY